MSGVLCAGHIGVQEGALEERAAHKGTVPPVAGRVHVLVESAETELESLDGRGPCAREKGGDAGCASQAAIAGQFFFIDFFCYELMSSCSARK